MWCDLGVIPDDLLSPNSLIEDDRTACRIDRFSWAGLRRHDTEHAPTPGWDGRLRQRGSGPAARRTHGSNLTHRESIGLLGDQHALSTRVAKRTQPERDGERVLDNLGVALVRLGNVLAPRALDERFVKATAADASTAFAIAGGTS